MENVKKFLIDQWDLNEFTNDFVITYKKRVTITVKSYDKDHKLQRTTRLELKPNMKTTPQIREYLERYYYIIYEYLMNDIDAKINELNHKKQTIPTQLI